MAQQKRQDAFPAPEHDHTACIADALDAAESRCKKGGLRFTPLRRRVLEIVWNRHAPTGAYEILEELHDGKRSAAPPTVYRALEFLVENGFVHKIESLNAFVGCGRTGDEHTGQFLICENCRQVGEIDDPEIAALIEKKAAGLGFSVVQPTIEIMGLCRECTSTANG
ncbi:MAG: Fur family transcriptional regulator [Alphaproteobacteria bacterium]